MPSGDEKTVARDYAVSFGGNAVTAAFACAKLGIAPDLLASVDVHLPDAAIHYAKICHDAGILTSTAAACVRIPTTCSPSSAPRSSPSACASR